MTTSLWLQGEDGRGQYAPLSGNITADVAVIGGGITGVTTAYLLAKAGKRVVLFEKGRLGHGDTAYTTAFLTEIFDTPLADLAKRFSPEVARAVWQSGKMAIDCIEDIVREENLDCDFKRSHCTIVAADEKGWKALEKEQRFAEEFGCSATLSRRGLGRCKHGYQRYENQALFHPLKFVLRLAEKAVAYGVILHEDTHVHDMVEDKGSVTLFTDRGTCVAGHVVVATHTPMNSRVEVPARQTASLSYVIGGRIPKDALAPGLYLDTCSPYHYVRVEEEGEVCRVLIGGEDHKVGVAQEEGKAFARLEAWARDHIPGLGPIYMRWSGEIFESVDGLPYIGPSLFHPRQYVAACFAGNGMTFGVFSAIAISGEIMGKPLALAAIYRLSRMKAPHRMLKNGLATVWHFLVDRLKKRQATVSQIPKGSGMVLHEYGKPVAVYKGPDGVVTKCSAVCPHLHCIVQWNGTEKTWDCPCHGSRFAKDGSLMTGPATTSLPKE